MAERIAARMSTVQACLQRPGSATSSLRPAAVAAARSDKAVEADADIQTQQKVEQDPRPQRSTIKLLLGAMHKVNVNTGAEHLESACRQAGPPTSA